MNEKSTSGLFNRWWTRPAKDASVAEEMEDLYFWKICIFVFVIDEVGVVGKISMLKNYIVKEIEYKKSKIVDTKVTKELSVPHWWVSPICGPIYFAAGFPSLLWVVGQLDTCTPAARDGLSNSCLAGGIGCRMPFPIEIHICVCCESNCHMLCDGKADQQISSLKLS